MDRLRGRVRFPDDAAPRPHRGPPWTDARDPGPWGLEIRSGRRNSIAALACYKPGQRSRLVYRPRRDGGRRDGRKSFAWTDYRDLFITAHQQLGGPIVLVWDNLNVHLAYGMRQFIERQDWLTVYQLPSYAPDLNPVEGIWSLLRRGWLSNTAFTSRAPHPDHPARHEKDPVPPPPHRRMPRRNRAVPHPNDFMSSSSVGSPGPLYSRRRRWKR